MISRLFQQSHDLNFKTRDPLRIEVLLIVSGTIRRTRVEEFNIVRNDCGRTQKSDFFGVDQKYPFWVMLVQEI